MNWIQAVIPIGGSVKLNKLYSKHVIVNIMISLHISNCITPQLRVGKQQKKSVYLFSVKFFFFTKDTLYILNYPFLKTPDF